MKHKTFPYQNPWRQPMPHGCHVDNISLLFIRSLKSVYPSPYLSVRVVDPSTNFVKPTVPSLLVTLSLKSDFVNSILLSWDLPLSAAPHYIDPSLDTPDKHVGWWPQLVLGNRDLIDRVIKSHKCHGTCGKILAASYSNQNVTSSATPFPLYICCLSLSFLLFATIS